MYVLTEEGKNYLENGLPEKNLIELLKKGKTTVQIVRDKIDSFAIAIQWAKKNNWVMAVQGEIELIKEPEDYPEEAALKAVSEGRQVDEKTASILVNRKLIEKDFNPYYSGSILHLFL